LLELLYLIIDGDGFVDEFAYNNLNVKGDYGQYKIRKLATAKATLRIKLKINPCHKILRLKIQRICEGKRAGFPFATRFLFSFSTIS